MTPQDTLTYLNDVLRNIKEQVEQSTGLRVDVTFEIFAHMNKPENVRELTRAAKALYWERAEEGESVWYKTSYAPSHVTLFTNRDAEQAQ